MPEKITDSLRDVKGIGKNQSTTINFTLEVEGSYYGFPAFHKVEELGCNLNGPLSDEEVRFSVIEHCAGWAQILMGEELHRLGEEQELPDDVEESLNGTASLSNVTQTIMEKN